jgi:DNA-binding transcriptional ArsR family regulator
VPASPPPPKQPSVEEVFHALGDPTRRAVLERLSHHGAMSVSQLAEPFGMTLTAVTQHLQVLEASGLVHTEKLGRVRTCRLESAGFAVATQWLADRRSSWERKLDRLGDLLAEDPMDS